MFVILDRRRDPDGVLRKGFIEEIDELVCTKVVEDNKGQFPEELSKEIGDVLWYVSVICDRNGLTASDIFGGDGDTSSLQEACDKYIISEECLPIYA